MFLAAWRRHYRWSAIGLWLLGILLLIPAAFAAERSSPPAEPPALFTVAAPTPVITAWSGPPLEVDFDSVVVVPAVLRPAIENALAESRPLLPPLFSPNAARFTVTALRFDTQTPESARWLEAVLAPTHVVAVGWEADWWPDALVHVLGMRDPLLDGGEEWRLAVAGSPAYGMLSERVPPDFIDFRPLPDVSYTDYRFPWSSGLFWFKTWGWHSGDAIDFQPVLDSDPYIHLAVVASHAGRLTEICNDGVQSALQVTHSGGETLYFHLESETIRRAWLGQHVEQGQFLGLLYTGYAGTGTYNGWYYQYWTGCGGGTGPHLHFVVPGRDILLDGQDIARFGDMETNRNQYLSSTERIDRAR